MWLLHHVQSTSTTAENENGYLANFRAETAVNCWAGQFVNMRHGEPYTLNILVPKHKHPLELIRVQTINLISYIPPPRKIGDQFFSAPLSVYSYHLMSLYVHSYRLFWKSTLGWGGGWGGGGRGDCLYQPLVINFYSRLLSAVSTVVNPPHGYQTQHTIKMQSATKKGQAHCTCTCR